MTIIAFVILLVLLVSGYEATLPLFGLHGFLSILFPYVLFVVVILFGFGVFFKRKLAIIMLLGIVLVYSKIKQVIPLSFPSTKEVPANHVDIKVMSWNVHRFIAPTENNLHQPLGINHFVEIINAQKPDMLTLLDYAEKTFLSKGDISIARLKKLTGMKYSYFHLISKGYDRKYKFGNLILSKYPIQDHGSHIFNDYYLKKSGMSFVEIKLKQKKNIRVYTSHFQSFGLNDNDFKELQKIKYDQQFSTESTGLIYLKSSKSYSIRQQQVRDAENFIRKSQVPTILTTDLNDVPNSFSYNTFSKHYNDAFVEKGFNGLGRTYLRLLPTLRIDYIFSDKQFEILDYKTITKEVSDHYPIVAHLSLP